MWSKSGMITQGPIGDIQVCAFRGSTVDLSQQPYYPSPGPISHALEAVLLTWEPSRRQACSCQMRQAYRPDHDFVLWSNPVTRFQHLSTVVWDQSCPLRGLISDLLRINSGNWRKTQLSMHQVTGPLYADLEVDPYPSTRTTHHGLRSIPVHLGTR